MKKDQEMSCSSQMGKSDQHEFEEQKSAKVSEFQECGVLTSGVKLIKNDSDSL